jgi:hypothetical protein
MNKNTYFEGPKKMSGSKEQWVCGVVAAKGYERPIVVYDRSNPELQLPCIESLGVEDLSRKLPETNRLSCRDQRKVGLCPLRQIVTSQDYLLS